MENWEIKYSSKLLFSDNGCDFYDDWPICFLFLLIIVSLAMVRVQNIYNISENNHSWEWCVAEQIMLFGRSVPGLSRLHWWEIWHLVTVCNFRVSLCLCESNTDSESGLKGKQWLLLKTYHEITVLNCMTCLFLHPWHQVESENTCVNCLRSALQ